MQSQEATEGQNNQSQPLCGMRICALVSNNTSIDSRVKKECAALAEAGAHVTLIGQAGPDPYPGDISQLPYELILTQGIKIPEWYARWGRETVFYPLRVAVNLSLEPIRRCNFTSTRPWMLKAVRGRAFDVVHVNDFDMLTTGAKLAQRSGARLVYDSHEIFLADNRLAHVGQKRLEKLRRVEARLLKDCARVITVNESLARYLKDYYDLPEIPSVIYNGGTEVAESTQEAHRPLRILYLGNFAYYYYFPAMISELARLDRGFELVFQGFGYESQERDMRQAIIDADLQDVVRIIPPVPTADIVKSATGFDVGLCNFDTKINVSLKMASPNKLFDYLSAGLALVGSEEAVFLRTIVDETGCGYLYPDHSSVVDAIDFLQKHPGEVSGMKRRALVAAPYFSWDLQKKKLVELYQSLKR
ncbi:MAG: glycosyltransferase [Coriobacteriia bacterium]|nr:glycosyltransferase [Coriobacteriia bacterium]